MQQPRTHARLLWFTYLLSFYGSIAFPWTTASEQVYGLKIAGFAIEPHLLVILVFLIPVYFFTATRFESFALRRTVAVSWILTAIGLLLLGYSALLILGARDVKLIMAVVDMKTWYLFWMMPATVVCVHSYGLDRWLRHFFIATACYCVLLLVVRATPYGWGATILPSETLREDIFGRISAQNDYILILAIPLAVARLQDKGIRPLPLACLGLYLTQLASAQSRTHMIACAMLTLIVIARPTRYIRTTVTVALLSVAVLLSLYALPERQSYGLSQRLANMKETAAAYVAMLHSHNQAAFEQMAYTGPHAYLVGCGFGTSLRLGWGTIQETERRFVDNLWVTLLFKTGGFGSLLICGSILVVCWGGARGRPLFGVDRVFKWWAFLMPLLCLRGSFLLWHTTSGVTWSTLAVALVLAEQRRAAAASRLQGVTGQRALRRSEHPTPPVAGPHTES